MKNRLATESAIDMPVMSTDRPHPGLVEVFRRGHCVWVPHAVPAACTLGRDESADLIVEDASVSRVHLKLDVADGGYYVTDLGSRNGTFVRGERVTEPSWLAPMGSVLRIGKTLSVVMPDVTPYIRFGATPPPLVGGAALAPVHRRIETFGPGPAPVLILGETGTGKEIVARLLHEASGRHGKFVALNCATMPPELVDSELFGHAKGAYSGASSARPGLFRSADLGTLFLDEIGELPPPSQAKLLRVLETGEVRGVGQDHATRVDVRVVAATHRDLDALAVENQFRADLLHRLAAARIGVQPLRERVEDVPMLCRHFLDDADASLTVFALERLMLHEFPGNVRELKNVVGAALALARRDGRNLIEVRDIGEALSPFRRAPRQEDPARRRIVRALTEAGGNVSKAARALGMARSVFYETMHRLQVDPTLFRR